MEEKINIAEILKDKPQGTKLYSPLFGNVSLSYVQDGIINLMHHGGTTKFFKNGKYYAYPESEPLLFPSESMRDWSKFAWKKGDVLVSNDYGTEVIFYDWYDDTYTNFYCKYYLNSENKNKIVYYEEFLCTTERYSLEDRDAAKTYINTIEERLDGKLNLKTLEIEKQNEFSDGDILFVKCKGCAFIEIFNYYKNNGDLYDHASLDTTTNELDISGEYKILKGNIMEIRLSTEEEKQKLFSALAKKGKTWDAEKKQVVDLKIKWMALKPFDKVITRNAYDDIWTANIFSHMDSYGKYVTIGCVGGYTYCLPYNDETAHLLGTTDEWKVGER